MATDKLRAQADIKESGPAGTVQKKPYSPPQLTTYGHISKLTMAQAGTGNDTSSKATKMRMACL